MFDPREKDQSRHPLPDQMISKRKEKKNFPAQWIEEHLYLDSALADQQLPELMESRNNKLQSLQGEVQQLQFPMSSQQQPVLVCNALAPAQKKLLIALQSVSIFLLFLFFEMSSQEERFANQDKAPLRGHHVLSTLKQVLLRDAYYS